MVFRWRWLGWLGFALCKEAKWTGVGLETGLDLHLICPPPLPVLRRQIIISSFSKMTDPWKAWTHSLFQKTVQERANVTKAYEKIFDGCMHYLDFVQRFTLTKYCAWDIPVDSMVDRTLCRDYVIRRLARLGLSVTVVNDQQPYKLMISWIDPVPLRSRNNQVAASGSTHRPDEAEDEIASQHSTHIDDDVPEEDDDRASSTTSKPSKRNKASSSAAFSFFRKVANPCKIIGE